MPLFDYQAFAPDGKNKRGVVEAENVKGARQKLKRQGFMVTVIAEKSTKNPVGQAASVPFFGNRIGLADLTSMTRQLASLVKANIPLFEALNALVDQVENERLRLVLNEIRDDVKEGSPLSRALKQHPKVFDVIYINMVESGESSGTLAKVLIKLAELKEAQQRLRGKITSAMAYPAIMVFVGLVVTVGIFAFIIPKLSNIFVTMNKPIPTTTKVLMMISDFTVNFWPLLLIAAGVGWTFFLSFIRSKNGKPIWHRFLLKMKLFGPLFRLVAVARFANTLGTLLATGVPIIQAMDIAKNLAGNVHFEKAISEAKTFVTEGQSIAEPLKRSGEFPPMMIHMVAIGEKTGELPEMLQNIAETYEEQVDAQISAMTSLLEPIMIVGMGGFVGFVVYSVFMPLLEISNLSQ